MTKSAIRVKKTLEDFNTSLQELKSAERNGEEIEQNHYGDFLMIKEDEDQERYRVWLNHPENVAQGEPAWQIEYAGAKNCHRWETVGQGNY